MKQCVSHCRKPQQFDLMLFLHFLLSVCLFVLHLPSPISLQKQCGKLLYMKCNFNKLDLEAPVLNPSLQTQ